MKLEGYHATVELSMNIIDQSGKLKRRIPPVAQLPGDLGTGTYFFKDDPVLARQFLEKRYPSHRIKIIKCTIDVDDDFILDLNDQELFKHFLTFRERNLEHSKIKFSKLKGYRNCIDGIIVDSMIKSILEEDKIKIKLVIKDTYTPTKDYSFNDKYFISNFFNGTELCVIDNTIVKEGELCNGL